MSRFSTLWILVVLCTALLAPQLQAAEKLTDCQVYQLRTAMQILRNLGSGEISLDKQFEMVFGPIAKANQSDMQHNRKVVQTLVSKAKEARSKSESQAKEYMRLAKAYKAYSDVNLAIVEAYKKEDAKKISEAIDRLVDIETRIRKMSGRTPARSWFTPDEVQDAAMTELAKRQSNGNRQQ